MQTLRAGCRPAVHAQSHQAVSSTSSRSLPMRGVRPARPVQCIARRSGESPSAARPRWFSKKQLLPSKLITESPPQDPARQHTVYTVRLTTGQGRGAGIDEPEAGVFLCLIGKDGASYLHYVSPLYDAEQAEKQLQAICNIADKEAGANCSVALGAAAVRAKKALRPKRRFQPGAVDEVCFLGPELGPLVGLLAAPQAGSWLLDEAHVASSRTRHTDRFVCREVLGEDSSQPAAYLTAVPAGAVVYGSGSSAVTLTKEQAAALHAMGMLDYGALKGRLTVANAALVAIGTTSIAISGGWEAAAPFAAGGCMGLLYQILLQSSVDALPGSTQYSPPSSNRFMRAMSSGYARFTFIIVATLCSIHALDLHMTPDADSMHTAATTAKFFTGAAGFLCYKLAVLAVTAVPTLGNTSPPKPPRSMQVDRR